MSKSYFINTEEMDKELLKFDSYQKEEQVNMNEIRDLFRSVRNSYNTGNNSQIQDISYDLKNNFKKFTNNININSMVIKNRCNVYITTASEIKESFKNDI